MLNDQRTIPFEVSLVFESLSNIMSKPIDRRNYNCHVEPSSKGLPISKGVQVAPGNLALQINSSSADEDDYRIRFTSTSYPSSSEATFPLDFDQTTQLMFERIQQASSSCSSKHTSTTYSPTNSSGRSSAISNGNSTPANQLVSTSSTKNVTGVDHDNESGYFLGVSLEENVLDGEDYYQGKAHKKNIIEDQEVDEISICEEDSSEHEEMFDMELWVISTRKARLNVEPDFRSFLDPGSNFTSSGSYNYIYFWCIVKSLFFS